MAGEVTGTAGVKGADAAGVPQILQKLSVSLSWFPQVEQVLPAGLPHLLQNLLPAVIFAPQYEHFWPPESKRLPHSIQKVSVSLFM